MIREFKSYSFGSKEECNALLEHSFKEKDKTFDEFHFIPEYNEIIDWLSNTNGKGLFLTGDGGRGKSNLIELVIPELFMAKQKKVITTVSAYELGSRLDEIKNKRFISIDDVGTETPFNNYGIRSEPFSQMVDFAERNCSILFISTNLNKNQILDRYGVRSLDRIQRLCRIVRFQGSSLRK